MRIQWEVDDGYAVGNRPHFVDIDEIELEECETEEEINELIEGCVGQAFCEDISYYWKVVK